ncbi:TraR/DksA C4-type zinc finger protein [Thalassobacillus pellis]|uniref:TraR/DksA C4-type zinc finger protein n=1 Tax=Thalassobacillus pellis TaxID=748008 RepID=UPI00196209BF|nr:TraR/DksA C4-type zinc finger protein [Thalassobacillus pellis]MBM7554346.1 YteA family regulatory protein [Thalassobacillus pellis]
MKYQHLKKQLEERKREIEEELEQNDHFGLNRGFASDTSSGELSQYDNHPADSGTELYEREKDIALNEHMEEELTDIEYSLKQMAEGTYGTCEVTGKEIPMDRLEALPTARTVVEASPNQSASHDSPVEEDVLRSTEEEYYTGGEETEYNEQNTYHQVASFNESSMTYEGSSLIDNHDGSGYVETYEQFASTGIEGYVGDEAVQFQRNVQYDQYMQEQDNIEEEE